MFHNLPVIEIDVIEQDLTISLISTSLFASHETEGLFFIRESSNFFLALFVSYVVGQTKSQEATYAATFDQIKVADFCVKDVIISAISKPKETNELGIKTLHYPTWNECRYGVLERKTNYIEIEITYFMINTSYQCVVKTRISRLNNCHIYNCRCLILKTMCCHTYLWKCHRNSLNQMCKYRPNIYNYSSLP